MKADPAGTVRQRADGSVWEKPTSTSKEWTQVKDGVNAQSHRVPGQGGVAEFDAGSEGGDAWAKAQAQFDLDGHKPSEETHPQHVNVDADGDIDKKPVLMWKDKKGNDRRSYTKRFHWNRYSDVHGKTKGVHQAFQKAHDHLMGCCEPGHPDLDAAMAAFVYMKTGHPLDQLLALHPEATHVPREMKKSGQPDLFKGQTTDKLREILTATMMLRDRTQSFHWNVTGPLFPQLHGLFGDQYDDLADAVDILAERIRGFELPVEEVSNEPQAIPDSAEAMVVELLSAHERLCELCEQGVEAAEADGDAGTVDILGKRAADHDKAAWFLRSTAGLQKGGHTSDASHPDRAHFMLRHPRGHAYTASILHPKLAEFVHGKRNSGENSRVFNTKPSKVKSMLKKAGVGHFDTETMQHASSCMMAADYLSKTPKYDVAKEGLDKACNYMRKASAFVARQFGHEAAPQGMSFVPPGVAMGYLEDLGAHKAYPKAFEALKRSDAPSGPRDEVRADLQQSDRAKAEATVRKAYGSIEGREADIERIIQTLSSKKSKINKGNAQCSPTEAATSSTAPTLTTSNDQLTSSSTTLTAALKSITLGQSSQSSKEMTLDSVIEKGAQYLARLSPAQGDNKARYVYDKTAFLALLESDHFANILAPGVKFHCPIHTGEKYVDGFISIEDRVGQMMHVSHDGNGRRGSMGVDQLQRMLLEYHQPFLDTAGDCAECEGCDDCEEWDEDAENEPAIIKATDMSTHVDVVKADGIPDEFNKPRRIRQGEPGYGKKKFVVNARNAQGKTRVIRFGDANMEIRRDDPKRRANFRSRHGCDTAAGKDILTAKYWSCQQWRGSEKVVKGNTALHDWGTVQPEHEVLRSQANAAYVDALRRSMAGKLSDDVMKAMSMAVLNRDYDKVIKLAQQDTEFEPVRKAVWTTAYVNDLPDSAFLYVESGGDKDDEGKTVPRSLRHLPYKDANGKVDLPHLRNALARLDGTDIPDSVKSGIRKRAQRLLENVKESRVAKGEEGVKPVKAPPTPSAAPSGEGTGAGAGSGHPGPKGLPIGAQVQRKDGVYVKEGERKWSRMPEHVRGKKAPEQAKDGGSATEEGLRDRIIKLRTRLKGASKEERSKLVLELTKLRARLKQARRGSGGRGAEVKKANEAIAGFVEISKAALDPVDSWLAKGLVPTNELDEFIKESVGDFSDFAEDLAIAPTVVRSQAHYLRMAKGPLALRAHYNDVKGKLS